jgi:hypothetical protein
MGLFQGWLLVSKRLDHGSQAVMTRFLGLVGLVSGLGGLSQNGAMASAAT